MGERIAEKQWRKQNAALMSAIDEGEISSADVTDHALGGISPADLIKTSEETMGTLTSAP